MSLMLLCRKKSGCVKLVNFRSTEINSERWVCFKVKVHLHATYSSALTSLHLVSQMGCLFYVKYALGGLAKFSKNYRE